MLNTPQRPGAIILVGGDEVGLEGARRTIAGFFKWVEVTNEGLLKFSSPDDRRTGTVGDDAVLREQAHQLGKKLGEIIRAHYE
jgi:hypothetical protein